MEPHDAQADRTLPHSRVFRPLHLLRRTINKVLQHVVQKPHYVLDQQRVVLPLQPAFEVKRRQATHRRPLLAMVIEAGRQRDLAAQVARLHL